MKVVLLLGPSTAGKSTICNELVANHKWKSVSSDEIAEKIINERKPKLQTKIREELVKQNLFTKLQSYMSDEEIITLAGSGRLAISKGDHQLSTPVQFPNPDLPELEEVLKKSGFNENIIPELTADLRLVTQIGFKTTQKFQFSIPELMDRLYDETYSHDPEASIIIDLVPDQDGTYDVFEHFEKRAKQYRDENPNNPLTTSIALAYCPPQKLSERIDKRNLNADKTGNLGDKREGLFPFYQLATLTTAKGDKTQVSSEKFSRDELFSLVEKHAKTTKIGDAIFLENPIDYEALQGTVSSDKDQSSAVDKPRIGSKKTIEEYNKLANKFGFFENQERSSITIPNKEKYDVIINTAIGSPASLATELLEKLEQRPTPFDMNKK